MVREVHAPAQPLSEPLTSVVSPGQGSLRKGLKRTSERVAGGSKRSGAPPDRDGHGAYSSVVQDDDDDDSDDSEAEQRKEKRTLLKQLMTGRRRSKEKDEGAKPIVDTMCFQMVSAMLILLNTACIAAEGIFIQRKDLKPMFELLECFFTAWYCVELFWKVGAKGLDFFCGEEAAWNLFDAVITVTGALDLVIEVKKSATALFEGGSKHMRAAARKGQSSGVSVARLFRLLRILRIFRSLRFLSDVEHVIYTAGKATVKLIFLVLMVIFVAAVVATHILYDSDNADIQEMFLDLGTSMLTLFEIMTLDGWTSTANLVTSEYPGMIWFFLIYIFCAAIALMSLVPAIFVELNLENTAKEKAAKAKATEEQAREDTKQMLHRLFHLTDVSKNGLVSREEMAEALSRHEVQDALRNTEVVATDQDLSDVSLTMEDLFGETQDAIRVNPDFASQHPPRPELAEIDFVDGFLRGKEVSDLVVWRSLLKQRAQTREIRDIVDNFKEESLRELADVKRHILMARHMRAPPPGEPPGGATADGRACFRGGAAHLPAPVDTNWLHRVLAETDLAVHFDLAAAWAAETGCLECDLVHDAEALSELAEYLRLRKYEARRLRRFLAPKDEAATAEQEHDAGEPEAERDVFAERDGACDSASAAQAACARLKSSGATPPRSFYMQ